MIIKLEIIHKRLTKKQIIEGIKAADEFFKESIINGSCYCELGAIPNDSSLTRFFTCMPTNIGGRIITINLNDLNDEQPFADVEILNRELIKISENVNLTTTLKLTPRVLAKINEDGTIEDIKISAFDITYRGNLNDTTK